MQLKSFIMCFTIIALKQFIMCFIINLISNAPKKLCFFLSMPCPLTNATKKIHHVFGLAVRVAISGEPWYTLVIYLSLCLFCCRIPPYIGQPPGLAKLFLFCFIFLHLKRVVLFAGPVRLLQPGT